MTTLALRPFPRTLLFLAAAALLGAQSGCNVVQPAQDDPTRYFVLSDPAVPPGQIPSAGGVRIGLRSVRLESYLKRREIVVRTGDNEVEFRDFRRWAEPLDTALCRVLKAKLLSSPEVSQVVTEPFPVDSDRDYDVAVEIRRCEGLASRSGHYGASLVATIEVSTAGPSPRVIARRSFSAPDAPWDGSDFDRLASLLTADAEALGQEIVSALPPRG